VTFGEEFGRRLMVSTDAAGYGRSGDARQAAIQKDLLVVLDWAAGRAGLARSGWDRQAAGDGELALLPESESEPRVVDDFVRALCWALTAYNDGRQPPARLRLRMAINHGVAMPASNGFSGQGVVATSRLVDCGPLHAALQTSDADLALILSERVFNDTVAQRHTSLRPRDFRRVPVRHKEFTDHAWVHVPGCDVHALDLSGSDQGDRGDTAQSDRPAGPVRPDGQRSPAVSAGVHNQFHDVVVAPDGTFGIRL